MNKDKYCHFSQSLPTNGLVLKLRWFRKKQQGEKPYAYEPYKAQALTCPWPSISRQIFFFSSKPRTGKAAIGRWPRPLLPLYKHFILLFKRSVAIFTVFSLFNGFSVEIRKHSPQLALFSILTIIFSRIFFSATRRRHHY